MNTLDKLVKRNNLNVDQAEMLIYVHYNLKLSSHYCNIVKNDRKYTTCDNYVDKDDLEDGAIALEHSEVEFFVDGNQDVDHAEMPLPSTTTVSRIQAATALASQHPHLLGGHVAHGDAQLNDPLPTAFVVRSGEKSIRCCL